ncbi:DedA family protein/thiosulfate sulfurtransferase GlpE [Variovorax sp. J22R133]|uniref:DedA family protein/thiosulfate sulfurtransferase GlpE n=1 Tax=Variovorax brevis TaxID=3053503 RepID=UPI0025759B9C|nr:DedA family protein/thiosulfate sulfurtransferase GlpE [Variovorax sp. J22R133]MDM0114737.1 DedA family protein/thiosulfate sulfurtransferase GlpE [Variovorax sp. J22R133]
MEQLLALATQHGVLVVFIATLAKRLGAPLPGSAIMVVAGGLVASGALSLPAIVAAAVVGNVLGDAAWFYLGRHFGYRVMRLLCKVSLSPDSCVRRSETLITDWGGVSLIAAKFVPGVSVVAPPMAGALHMPLLRFAAFDGLAALIWTGVYLGLGWAFSGQIQAVLEALADAGVVGGAILAVLIAIGLAVRYWQRRSALRDLAIPRIGIDELRTLLEGEPMPVVIDVRSEASAAIKPHRIPGAITIHPKGIEQHVGDLPHDRDIVLYCDCPNEVTAAKAATILTRHGFHRARPLAGGLEAWLASQAPGESVQPVVAGISSS